MVREFVQPSPVNCADFVAEQAKRNGVRIGKAAAQQLVSLVGCDYFALGNETAKLAVYSDGGEITGAHVTVCVSRSLEYNVFEIHRLFINRLATQAQAMLNDLIEDERPEMLIGLFARKMRDMYKVKTMLDAGFGQGTMATKLGMKPFAVQMLAKESARFSQHELRQALMALADLDYGTKSGLCDASLALPETLTRIYKL
jgi:DNA polymerase-3 subunit delta